MYMLKYNLFFNKKNAFLLELWIHLDTSMKLTVERYKKKQQHPNPRNVLDEMHHSSYYYYYSYEKSPWIISQASERIRICKCVYYVYLVHSSVN